MPEPAPRYRTLAAANWSRGTVSGVSFDSLSNLTLADNQWDGTFVSEQVASGTPRCEWHRIILDADIPENSSITVFFTAANRGEAPQGATSSITFTDTREAAIPYHVQGEYLTLLIELHRERGAAPPVLRGLRVFYPRTVLLRHLPAVYRDTKNGEDASALDFLRRFLAPFESILSSVDSTISRIPSYFDPRATPEQFVPWLAQWLSLDLYELLKTPGGVDRNREFIQRAWGFYKQKGTVAGLVSLVTFLTGQPCSIKEYMNNVLRTRGMEHCEADELQDASGRPRSYHKLSRTVNTADSALVYKKGTYEDEVHYVIDTSDTARYHPRVIGIFFRLSKDQALKVEKEHLLKIIKTFLPVFIRVEIVVESALTDSQPLSAFHDAYTDTVKADTREVFNSVTGSYRNETNWTWLYAWDETHRAQTNSTAYRTPHVEIGSDKQEETT